MSDLSPIEEQFPRLVQEILGVWGTADCFGKLEELLVDKRGDRHGFPEAVYSDLSMLLTIVPRPKGPYDIWSDALDADATP